MEEYKGLSAGMKILLAKAEELDWWWSAWIEESQNGRTYVEMGQHSPAGEDFSMIIDFEAEDQSDSFLDNLESYYEDFDVDEHIEMWVNARGDVSGIPSVRELAKDAEDIDAMILELFQTLKGLEA